MGILYHFPCPDLQGSAPLGSGSRESRLVRLNSRGLKVFGMGGALNPDEMVYGDVGEVFGYCWACDVLIRLPSLE